MRVVSMAGIVLTESIRALKAFIRLVMIRRVMLKNRIIPVVLTWNQAAETVRWITGSCGGELRNSLPTATDPATDLLLERRQHRSR